MKTCCICKKKFEGWGNNPWGYIKDHKVVEWKDTDVCCNDCNNAVILGRILLSMTKNKTQR